jgi:hypothetical protein
MTLFLATFTFGLFLTAIGVLFAMPSGRQFLKALGRSTVANFICFGAALGWFLYEITLLGPADFGQYKTILLWTFGPAGVAAFYYIPDFLSIRGLAGIGLLWARPLLDAAYLQPYQSRLFLVSAVYAMIALCLYLGAYPYRYRDFLGFVEQKPVAQKSMAYGLMGLGAVMVILSLFFK